MADDKGETQPVPAIKDKKEDAAKHQAEHHIEMDHEFFTRPGAQLSERQTFTNKKGEKISGYAVIVDFRRILQLETVGSNADNKEHGIIPGMSNRELLHAVVGLYDVSLSEMTPDVLYSTVCEKWARTIILIRDLHETIDEYESRRGLEPKEEKDEPEDEEASVKDSEICGDEDVYEEEEATPSKFNEVYSDTESEEGEEEEEDTTEEDFSKGINAFIAIVADRRKARRTCEGPITSDMVGVESRIVGCATFEKKYVKHRDRVIHLTLVSVRKRCRNFGIGKYLLSQIVEPRVVGNYDAVVVHADNEAVEFFQKFGFSDDIVLNSRWRELAEQFTNCSLMCYLPGFSGHRLLSAIKVPGIEMFELEQEFLKWKEKSLEVYQQQITCMMRMKHEVLQLKHTAITQDKFLKALVEENEHLRTAKLLSEKELLDYRLSTVKSAFGTDTDALSTQELIHSLQREVQKMDLQIRHKRNSSRDFMEILANKPNGSYTVVGESRYVANSGTKVEEPYDHIKDSAFFYDVSEQFKQQMMLDSQIIKKCEVTTISKALVPEKQRKVYKERIQRLTDPLMVLDLYFCGTLEHPERIKEILRQGFSERDMTCGEYGKGLYFSKYPSKAAQFSKLGSLLRVEVGIGNVETIVQQDRTRTAPSTGYDSIITPGRLTHLLGQGDASLNQEYIVFDPCQTLPLCLLTYEAS
ncbi:uncharacterized protein LOC127880314 isoform X2 [Dreissena polymorpha]|uniref:N-acetyltransferase domain-containing protein n=1 Tax=Dreissena polymorpha TaxID=45954 RepID=A0A9D4HBQ7_DREPO|nr:uncharacterized protein LOC127880314 isoform X2 [Dreissena polymorpha]KAH3831837.1 hypothetical protein DPMN_105109 [Dreissena polymorpha]